MKKAAKVLIHFEWLVLVLLLPVALFPSPLRLLAFLLLPLLWFARKVATGRFIPATPLDWPLALLLFMVLVTLFVTPSLPFALSKISGLVYGIALFYAAVDWINGRWSRLWLVLSLLLSLGVGVAGLGLLGTRWSSSKLPFVSTIQALIPTRLDLLGQESGFHPNQVAGTLLWILPLALVLALLPWLRRDELRPWRGRLQTAGVMAAAAGAALFISVVFVLTQSRSGLIGLATGLVGMVLIVLTRNRLLFGTALVVMLAAGYFIVGEFLERPLLTLFSEGAFTELTAANAPLESFGGRVQIWIRAGQGAQDFALTGMGLGMARQTLPQLYPFFLDSSRGDFAHAHNHILQTFLDLGVPGAVAYLAIWLLLVILLYRSWKSVSMPSGRLLVIGFGGSLAAYFGYGLTDTVALGARPGFIFWLLLALVVSYYQFCCLSPD